MDFISDPKAIETKSMEIIDKLIAHLSFPAEELPVVKRVVHTTGDPNYAEIIKISPGAVAAGLQAIRSGCHILTDVNMLKTGINKTIAGNFNCQITCDIADPEVAAESKATGLTRAMIALHKNQEKINGGIIAIGNAPTALFELMKLMQAGIKPALVIGTPVGFVGARESKEFLANLDIPHITIVGNKGGSTVAASIVNALLYMA